MDASGGDIYNTGSLFVDDSPIIDNCSGDGHNSTTDFGSGVVFICAQGGAGTGLYNATHTSSPQPRKRRQPQFTGVILPGMKDASHKSPRGFACRKRRFDA
jgi:hypothetical protein